MSTTNTNDVGIEHIPMPDDTHTDIVLESHDDNAVIIEEAVSSKKSKFSKFKKNKKSKDDEYTGDLMMVLGIYSSLCGITTVYSGVLPTIEAGVQAAFWMVIIVGLLFTYSIVLIVIGLRPRETTMLDEIISDAWPALTLPLRILGQFTAGWMMIVFVWVGSVNNPAIMQSAFTTMRATTSNLPADILQANKDYNKKIYRYLAIAQSFIVFGFSCITNPAIFVPLTSLPTIGTIVGFIATTWWVCKNTTSETLDGFKAGWSGKSGKWLISNSDGLTAMFTLVGVLAGNFYLHSMIQQLLARAKFPEHNVRNTVIAFCLCIVTILFTNFVAALPFCDYNGNDDSTFLDLKPNLANGMGNSAFIRASNIILWIFNLPIAPFQWAVLRQNTVMLIPWEKHGWKKIKWPIIITIQASVIAIGFCLAYFGVSLQILIQIATFPAALYWVCFMPAFFHIWSMGRDPVQRKKWYFIPWSFCDILVGAVLLFAEIVQFVPKW